MSFTKTQVKKQNISSMYKVVDKSQIPQFKIKEFNGISQVEFSNSSLITSLLNKKFNETPKKASIRKAKTESIKNPIINQSLKSTSIISSIPQSFCSKQTSDEIIPIKINEIFQRPKIISAVEESDKISESIKKFNIKCVASSNYEKITKHPYFTTTGIVSMFEYVECLNMYKEFQEKYLIYAKANNDNISEEFKTELYFLEMWFINIIKPIGELSFKEWAMEELFKLKNGRSVLCNPFFKPFFNTLEKDDKFFDRIKSNLFKLGISKETLMKF